MKIYSNTLDEITEVSTDINGNTLTCDHINDRDIEYPHRISNLQWATHAQQYSNRAAK